MDSSQVIRRALRVAEECDAEVRLDIWGDEPAGSTISGKIKLNHEDDEVFVGKSTLIAVESIASVTFSRGS